MLKIRKVVVGVSGGVDSAVTALLLKNKGFDVHGVFMQNWDIKDEKGFCNIDEDFKDASFVCDKLKIPLNHVNFVKEYWNEVFTVFAKEYESGFTPNPDVLCNRHIKFNHFYKYAVKKLGADAIATGHYARTSFGSFLEKYNVNKKVRLLKPFDNVKDQTFFLCQVNQEPLRKTMFPLGELNKSLVKKIAVENGLEKISMKKESMGICFIGSRKFQEFIDEYIPRKPGKFVDIDTGEIVGEHMGIHQWTLGQRCNIGGKSKAYFTAKKDVATNKIYVALGTNHPSLFSNTFMTTKPHWISEIPENYDKYDFLRCQFTFQHTHDLCGCILMNCDKGLIVKLDEDVRALTEGQFAVFYLGEECIGSAQIINVGPSRFLLDWMDKSTCNVKENLEKLEALIGEYTNGNSIRTVSNETISSSVIKENLIYKINKS